LAIHLNNLASIGKEVTKMSSRNKVAEIFRIS